MSDLKIDDEAREVGFDPDRLARSDRQALVG
jgi:hypothetical protein